MSPLVTSVLATAMSPAVKAAPQSRQPSTPETLLPRSLLTPVLPQTGIMSLERRLARL